MALLGEDGATVLGLEAPTSRTLLTIIPARGGSTRLRGKNILPFEYSPMFARFAVSLPGRVVVSTDDDTIASMARLRGLDTHRRNPVPDDQDIPTASAIVARDLNWTGPVLTVQPTISPLPSLGDIDRLLQSPVPAVLTAPGRHDIWLRGVRQGRDIADQILGIYYWPPGTVGEPPASGVQVHEWYHDIDTPEDYQAALHTRHTILVHAAQATTWNGTGHLRRQTELALHLQHHDVIFDDQADKIPDLIMLDVGDTSTGHIAELRERYWSAPIISFEDRGAGAAHVDAVINAILPPLGLPHEYHGGDYAVIRSEFLGLRHERRHIPAWPHKLLVLFGGTDAKNLANRVGHLFAEDYEVMYRPQFVAEAMMDCDLLICGAGQIVHEAAYLGVPTIVIAATQREASHGHLGPEYGNIFLGLAAEVEKSQIVSTVQEVLDDPELQREMFERSYRTVDGKGIQRIKHIIEGLLI